eukprot:1008301-Pelagomonas_calceolata.AAC.15
MLTMCRCKAAEATVAQRGNALLLHQRLQPVRANNFVQVLLLSMRCALNLSVDTVCPQKCKYAPLSQGLSLQNITSYRNPFSSFLHHVHSLDKFSSFPKE